MINLLGPNTTAGAKTIEESFAQRVPGAKYAMQSQFKQSGSERHRTTIFGGPIRPDTERRNSQAHIHCRRERLRFSNNSAERSVIEVEATFVRVAERTEKCAQVAVDAGPLPRRQSTATRVKTFPTFHSNTTTATRPQILQRMCCYIVSTA